MNEILRQIGEIGIVPVIAISDVEKAVPLARSLAEGGIPCAEVTFRTAEGEESIRRIAKECPDVLLGAGTVLSTEQVDRAISAGARFIVSPGLNSKVVAHCADKGITITPGCSNPSDVDKAIEMGLDIVKFFPAEQAGGLDYIKAIAAPYKSVKFMPTGGINAGNLAKYLMYEKILACGGSWMVKADLINASRFDEITHLCEEAMNIAMGFEFKHMGFNAANANEAKNAAQMFETLFHIPVKAGNSSIFATNDIEIMKSPGYGKKGHICFSTNSIERAVAYFERRGIKFDKDSARFDTKGKYISVFFAEEICGFAVHLAGKEPNIK
ncbi:MAG: bifunctional 4-hydroxy-2-oxoglutarate aldolase/2-dehydro-3-deoxy-phosphogluconate aldolase [Synergistaceae bacterium]|nr:bifunctional 4-hydroxy-2-oxoglutarate aldolase/2-dehydro-3-deoxy-phosphogluconate aldolase [Synergistaceae bacterium]